VFPTEGICRRTAIGREAFGDFLIEANGINTVLAGDLDQAALYGTLNRVLSLGFELVELSRLGDRARLRPSFRRGGLLYLDELQAQRPHPVEDGVQTRLVEVSGQDGNGRLDLHRHVGKRLLGGRTERADDPDLIDMPGHQGLLPGSSHDSTMLAAIRRAGIIRPR
jgi:hypothetical protein